MVVQGTLSALSASSLAMGTPLNSIKCDRDAKALPHRDAVCRDEFATVALSLLRFIGAAYTTGDSGCWEAAYGLAGDRVGTSEAPLLVARAAALARVVRLCRDRDLAYLPSSCNHLSIEEAQLMVLIEAARNGDPMELSIAVSTLVEMNVELKRFTPPMRSQTCRGDPRCGVYSVTPGMAARRWRLISGRLAG